MSFITRHNTVVIHTHLSLEGKRRLANGDLTISKIAFSDAEVNYGFGYNSGGTYSSATLNYITSSPYRKEGIVNTNYDGTSPFILGSNDVYSTTESVVEQVPSIGFFSSITNSNVMRDYRLKTELAISTGMTPTSYYNGTGTTSFGSSPNYYYFNLSGATTEPPSEGLVYIKFIVPSSPNVPEKNGENVGFYSNFYRYSYVPGSYNVYVDRAIPQYQTNSTPKEQPMWFFPLSGYSSYYGSGATTVCPIWNMNIIHKTQNIGHPRSAHEVTQNATYADVDVPIDLVKKKYGSKNISGIVKSLGLGDLSKCAILHYSNSYSGSVYGDAFVPRETIVDMPHILWHRNGLGIGGLSTNGGLKLVDAGSTVYYDVTGKTSYTLLRDGTDSLSQVVGRVYFEKKLIALTDPELITALDPKSNRNWTCPKLSLDLVSSTDNTIVQNSGFTGLAQLGKRYYITYHMVSYPGQGPRQSVPNSYIQSIDGAEDEYGQPMYIRGSFPANSFPFLRGPGVLSGTGFNCQWIQCLVQEFDIEDDPGIMNLDPFKWKVSTIFGLTRRQGATTYMTASEVNSKTFLFTREEYDSYTKNFVMSPDSSSTGIGQLLGLDKTFWPGDVDFFFGNVTTQAHRKHYVRNVHFSLSNNDLNTTSNSTYTSGSTYITEVLLLGSDNKILGVGKPDRPIEKNVNTLLDVTLKSYY